jgi:predicted nucleotidyltransferase
MPLSKDLREFLALLNSNEVEYLVVGAFAVAYHGFPRYTADLDLLVRPTAENADRTIRALAQFGFGSLGILSADIHTPGMVVQLGVKPNRIDLLTGISGVTFEEAWASRREAELEGVAVQFIGCEALLLNKESTGRAKDLGDAEELRKRNTKREG